jgi:hypothetical protein
MISFENESEEIRKAMGKGERCLKGEKSSSSCQDGWLPYISFDIEARVGSWEYYMGSPDTLFSCKKDIYRYRE